MAGKQSKYEPGQQVGEWTLVRYRPGEYRANGTPTKPPAWLCQCSCGTLRWVQSANLQSGSSQSCGHGQPSKDRYARKNARPAASVFELGGDAYV